MSSQGLRVCFTGPAYGLAGEPILRQDLKLAAQALGMVVQDNFSIGTDLLVASRSDTAKAAKAASRGIPVMGYQTFLSSFQVATKPQTGAPRCPYVDTHQLPQPVGPHPSLLGGPEL